LTHALGNHHDKETEMTELASWITDGVSIPLPWNRRRNESRVTVSRSGPADALEANARRGRADGYYEAHRSETYDRIAFRGPIL
jgi:hypothetical protein